jgi:hypothetical protein
MLTTSTVKIVLRKPWWPLVKNEAARVIAIRAKALDEGLKPHGSVLGQMFIEAMNGLPDLRSYVHYLTSRGWPELVSDIEGDLSPEMLEVLRHEEGSLWFKEFQKFVLEAWNNSIPHPDPDETFSVLTRRMFTIIKDELSLHLERKVSPALMANSVLELLRDSSDPVTRKATTLSITFLSARSWQEVLDALGVRFSENFSKWDTPEATAYFDRFKAMILAQIEDFWDQQLEVKGDTEPPEDEAVSEP